MAMPISPRTNAINIPEKSTFLIEANSLSGAYENPIPEITDFSIVVIVVKNTSFITPVSAILNAIRNKIP
jgi:hypothetical protein